MRQIYPLMHSLNEKEYTHTHTHIISPTTLLSPLNLSPCNSLKWHTTLPPTYPTIAAASIAAAAATTTTFIHTYIYTMSYPIFSTIEYWLVKHPKIINFTWSQGETLGSSPKFLSLTILSYLSLTFFLSHYHIPSLGPSILKPVTAVHNLTLLISSLIMALGCTLSIFSQTTSIHHFICFPPQTPPTGPLFFWAYMFYLSKILEYVDTLLIILSESMIRRLTFLHVYHHAMVVVMCYLWLQTSQSMFPVMLVTNASVHVVMYTYYLLCGIGVRPKWKRLVTDCQILQFFSSFGIMSLIFYYHLSSGSGGGCSGMWGWGFSSVFITSLLFLFLDFYYKNYAPTSVKTKVV